MATPKTLPQDTMGQQLLMQLLGGGGQETTSMSPGNIGPAMQVFGQAATPMNPEMLKALMTMIQQNAASEVPTLTAALANATGARSSANSPLALALDTQRSGANNQALVAIMENNLKQMQQANQAAGTIAGATKGTAQTKTGGVRDPMQMLLGGFLLNKADKSGMFGKTGKKLSELFGGSKDLAGGLTAGNAAVDFGGPVDYSLGGTGGGGMGFSAAPGGFPSFDATALGNYELPNYDFGGADMAGSFNPGSWDFAANYDLASGVDLGGTGLNASGLDMSQLFSFADGGDLSSPAKQQVSRAGGKGLLSSRGEALRAAEENAMAGLDPNAALKAVIAAAMQNPQKALGATIRNPGGLFPAGEPNPIDFLLRYLMPGQPDNIFSYADGGSLTGPAAGTPVVSRNRPMMGTAPTKPRQSVTGSTGANSNQLAGMSSSLMNGAQQRMTAEQFAALRETMMAGRQEQEDKAMKKGATIAATNVGMSQIPGYGQMYALANFMSKAAGGPDFGERLYTYHEKPIEILDQLHGPVLDVAERVTEPFVTGAKSIAGDLSNALRFADGGPTVGRISGRGTGTSDSITARSTVPGGKPIQVSNDEYILPADTVDMIGRQFLDQLIAATHMPVRR